MSASSSKNKIGGGGGALTAHGLKSTVAVILPKEASGQTREQVVAQRLRRIQSLKAVINRDFDTAIGSWMRVLVEESDSYYLAVRTIERCYARTHSECFCRLARVPLATNDEALMTEKTSDKSTKKSGGAVSPLPPGVLPSLPGGKDSVAVLSTHTRNHVNVLRRVRTGDLKGKDMMYAMIQDVMEDMNLDVLCWKALQNVMALTNADRGSLFLLQPLPSGDGRALVSQLFGNYMSRQSAEHGLCS